MALCLCVCLAQGWKAGGGGGHVHGLPVRAGPPGQSRGGLAVAGTCVCVCVCVYVYVCVRMCVLFFVRELTVAVHWITLHVAGIWPSVCRWGVRLGRVCWRGLVLQSFDPVIWCIWLSHLMHANGAIFWYGQPVLHQTHCLRSLLIPRDPYCKK